MTEPARGGGASGGLLARIAGPGFSNLVAALALVVALPPAVDWAIAWWTGPRVVVLQPASVTLRGTPVPDLDDAGQFKMRADLQGAVPETSQDGPVTFIVPVSYYNGGEAGDDIFVTGEHLTVSAPDGTVLFDGTALYDTSIVDAPRHRHWWLGDIEPWVPFGLLGRAYKSSEVVFVQRGRPDDCATCRFAGMQAALVDLAAQDAVLTVTLRIATQAQRADGVARCRIDSAPLAAIPMGRSGPAGPDTTRHYRRAADCTPI